MPDLPALPSMSLPLPARSGAFETAAGQISAEKTCLFLQFFPYFEHI